MSSNSYYPPGRGPKAAPQQDPDPNSGGFPKPTPQQPPKSDSLEQYRENGSSADKGPQDSSHAQYQEQRPPQQYYDWRPQQPSSTSSYPTSTSHQYQQTSTGSYPGSQASSGQQPYYGQSHRTVDQETGRSPAPGRAADQYTQRQHPSYSRETPWSTQWAWSAAHQDHYISRYNAQGQVEYQWSRSR